MWKFLEFVGYMAILLSVIPITGLLCFGNLKQALEYTRDWARVMGWTILAAIIFGLAFWPLIAPPPP